MKNRKKNLKNRILLVILIFLLVVLIMIYQFGYKTEEEKMPTAEEIAQEYIWALASKEYDRVNQYLDFNGLLTYVSLYNNWSYDIADEWDKIYESSEKFDNYDDMKKEIDTLFVAQLPEINLEKENIELNLVQNAKLIAGTKNLYKVVINISYQMQEYNQDDEIYLIKMKDDYFVVASNFVEEIANLCESSLITQEYTIRESLNQAISYIESMEGVITRESLNKNLYDYRFCTKDSSEKDLTVYNDYNELKDGDKIYLADLYAENDAEYYEVILNIENGHMLVGDINCIEK